MIKRNLPYILGSLLVVFFVLAFLLKDNLNNYISAKMTETAGSEVILSGEAWVDSLFNYTNNGENFQYTLIEFKSTGCNICKQMEPELEKIRNAEQRGINVVVMNVMNQNSQNVMRYFGISVVPTHLLLDNQGTEFFRKYGFISADDILATINQAAIN